MEKNIFVPNAFTLAFTFNKHVWVGYVGCLINCHLALRTIFLIFLLNGSSKLTSLLRSQNLKTAQKCMKSHIQSG